MPLMLLTFTIAEPRERWGTQARVIRKTPLRFVLTSLSQYASGVSSSGIEVGFTPAQLKTWSILPSSLIVLETKASTCEVLLTSTADV